MFFCNSLFQISLDVEKQEGAIIRDRDNKHHKLNNRIDRRLQTLIEIMKATIDEAMSKEASLYLQKRTKTKIAQLLHTFKNDDVQLETLGFYIMFVNFCERNKKLDDVFKKYTNSDLYFDNIDLLKKANLSENVESEMMRIAYDCVSFLKG